MLPYKDFRRDFRTRISVQGFGTRISYKVFCVRGMAQSHWARSAPARHPTPPLETHLEREDLEASLAQSPTATRPSPTLPPDRCLT